MDMNSDKLVITNDKGEKVECNKLFSFDSDETNLSYIVFTDNTVDKDGKLVIEVRTYDPTGTDLTLKPVTSERELKVVENVLNSIPEYMDELLNNMDKDKVGSDDDNGRR